MSVFTKSDYNPDDALFDSCIFTGIGFGANRVRLNNCIVKATGKIDSCYGLKAYNTYFNLTASGTAGFHDSIELYNCKLDLYGAGSIWQAYTDNTSVCICDGCIINSHIDNGYYVFVTNVGKWIVKNCIMTADNISTIRTTFGSDDILAFNILPNGYSHSGNEIGWSTNLVLPA